MEAAKRDFKFQELSEKQTNAKLDLIIACLNRYLVRVNRSENSIYLKRYIILENEVLERCSLLLNRKKLTKHRKPAMKLTLRFKEPQESGRSSNTIASETQIEKQTTRLFQEIPNQQQQNAPKKTQQSKICDRGSPNFFEHNLQNVILVPPATEIATPKSELRLTMIFEVPKKIDEIVTIWTKGVGSEPEVVLRKF